MSRPLLLITSGLILGTAIGHIVFYEWNLGNLAAGSIGFLWGGLVVLIGLAFVVHRFIRRDEEDLDGKTVEHTQHTIIPAIPASAASHHTSTISHHTSALSLTTALFTLLIFLFFAVLGTMRYAWFTAQEWPSWTAMKGQLERPVNRGNPDEFDYERWLWLQQKRIGDDGWTVVDRPQPLDGLRQKALAVRQHLIQRYADAGLEGDTLGLIAAMTLGDRSQVSTATRDLYAEAGASHLLAMSGLHLGVIVGLLSWLFGVKRLRWSRWRIPAIMVIIASVWCFAIVAGLPTSLVRAALMTTVFLIAMSLRRDTEGINNLMAAIMVMLLLRPTYLFDVGAQLSVLAVTGICLGYGPVWRWLISSHKPLYLWLKRHYLSGPLQLLLVSFSAQLLTTPLVAYYFHRIAPWGTLFSLVYIPITTLVIYVSLLLLVFPTGLLAQAISVLLGLQSWFMGVERRLPLSTIPDFWSRRAEPGLVIYNTPRCPAIHYIASPADSWVLVSDSARVAPDEGLRYIASSFWAKRLSAPPTLLSGRHTLIAGTLRVALLDFDLRWVAQPQSADAEHIDVLVIARGFRGHLDDVAKTILPRLVVLDASLRPWQVNQLYAEASVLGWHVWDVRTQGALYLALSN